MKIADYGKAITSYIESPTTAQKLKSKKSANLLAEVDFSDMSLPALKIYYERETGLPAPKDPRQLIIELKRLMKGLDEEGVATFSTGGRVHLAEGSEDIVEPSKSMQVDTTTKGLDLFTIDDFKDKAEIYVGAWHNQVLPNDDIKSALNKFTQKGIDDGTFSADEAIKVVQDLKFQFKDRAQKQRLRGVIPEGIGTVEREDLAGGTKLIDEYLGVQKEYQKAVDDGFQGTFEEFLRYKSSGSFAEGGRIGFYEGKLVRAGPNTGKIAVKDLKLIKDKKGNIISRQTAYFKDMDAANAAIKKHKEGKFGQLKFKKSKKILNNPKLKEEFLKYAMGEDVTGKMIRKKYGLSNEEFFEGGLRDIIKKDFMKFSKPPVIRPKTVNNILALLKDKEAISFLKKGEIVPDSILAKLKLTPSEGANATVRIAQIYGGNNFDIKDFKKIKKNTKISDKLFNNMNKFAFGNPYRSNLYKISLELIDEQLGNEKGTFESLKNKAKYILQKNKLKGFDINEIAGVTGSAKTGAGEFSQFIDILNSNLNQKQGASFQSAFSNARQKIAANPAVFDTEAKKINRLASKFESEYGFKLPRIRKLEDVEKFYSPKRLKDLTDQGIDIKKASKKLGYTIQMPPGAVTAQEFVEKPGLKEKFLKGIGVGAKTFGKVIKPVGYAIGTAAAYQAKSMADEMGIELKPQDYFMAVDSGEAEVAIDNWKRRNVPGYSEKQAGITLGKFQDDFEEVGKDTTFGKYNEQIKNIKLP